MNPFKTKYRQHPFEVGDKVIAVTSGPEGDSANWFKPRIEFRKVYVIRYAGFDDSDEAVVRLVGVFGIQCWDGGEVWLKASHFMLLSEFKANNAERLAAMGGVHLHFQPEAASEPDCMAASALPALPQAKGKASGRRGRNVKQKRSAEKPISVTLELSRGQLSALMSVMETPACTSLRMDNRCREFSSFKYAVCAAILGQCDEPEYALTILQLAPVYRELLRHWDDPSWAYGRYATANDDGSMAEARKAAMASIEPLQSEPQP